MLAQKLNTERQGHKRYWIWFLTLSAAFMLLAADVLLSAQTYEFSVKVRRLGDQIGAEVWVKSLTSSAPKLGNVTFSINYRTDFLDPADPDNYTYYQTDSILMDVNQSPTSSIPDYPYQEIESPFHSNNGYSALHVNTGSDYTDGSRYGYAEIEVNFNGSSSQGYQPSSEGLGSFMGMIVFDIVNHSTLNDTNTVGIGHNTRSYPSIVVTDINGNSYSYPNDISYNDPPEMKIKGITILNPRGPYESVDRDAQYLSLPVAGYPIYFERSGLINTDSYSYGTDALAYEFGYSLDGGTSYSSFLRVAETADSIKASEYDNYASGELETRFGGVPGYVITQANGDPLTTGGDGYGGIVRVIWNDDQSFSSRSEKAKLKITQLSTSGSGSDIDKRSTTSIYGVSDFEFSLSRFFFVQLNGSNEYLRTSGNYANASQLTVEAWVNLNTAGTAGSGYEPAVVASSGGPASPEEGAWMLYLKDGLYPAFRARTEGYPVDENAPFYIGQLVSPEPLSAVSSNFDLTNDTQSENHRNNWVHLAATVKNDSLTLYVNGQIVAQSSNQTVNNIRLKATNHPIWIGVNPNVSIDTEDYLNAGIKEVKIWRIALTPDQILQNAAGVYDPTGAVNPISEIDSVDDIRLGLELYYPLAANRLDQASNLVLQNGQQGLDFYKAGVKDNSSITYRPDKAHIQLISPTGGEGVSNLENEIFTIRWIGYGLGSVEDNSEDLFIEFSRDGGNNWEFCTDNTTSPSGVYLDTVEIESGAAIWEPYNNVSVSGNYNDLQGVGNTIEENYVKEVLVRVSGTDDNGQTDIYDVSGTVYVAPHFALKNGGQAIVYVPGTTSLNLSKNVTYMEAWIAPYRFPSETEGYFPIISKVDSTSGKSHYSFRLLSTGQLQLKVWESDGTELTVTSDATKPIAEPGTKDIDSTWYHVGVLINLANATGQSDVRFYIDGVPQTADSITQDLGTAVNVDVTNQYPTFFGYEPGTSSKTFVGEMKEIRFWNGYPAGMDLSVETTSNPSDVTKFIQGALTVRASDLLTTPTNYTENLVAAWSMDGGSFVNNGVAKSVSSTNTSLKAYIRGSVSASGTGASYVPTYPYIRVVEPVYRQQVPNTTTDLRVRWVGFDYDATGFNEGDAADSADLEYSIRGGGGLTIKPWTPVSSVNYNSSYTNALSLETDDKYLFSGVSNPVQFAGKFNVSIADPDDNGDNTYNDQAAIPPALTNARLQMKARATINSSTAYEYTDIPSLVNPGPYFDITPPSNFTVRVLLEGFHSGSDEEMNDIGESFDNLGLKISLFEEVAGLPGSKVDSAESISGYDSDASGLDATASPTRGTDGSRFGNVPFVFTTLYDGSYFVVVEHLNHLPVMSRFTAPFLFDGDDLSTWEIESGWDFQSWGQNSTPSTSDYMTASTDDKYSGNGLFSAYGEHEVSQGTASYDRTGLIFNQGRETSETNRMAAMVAGDVYRDGQINSLDRIRVRADIGSNVTRSDVTGDGLINAQDRDIVDRNGDKISSLIDLSVVQYVNGKEVEVPLFPYMKNYNPFEAISDLNPDRSIRMNEEAKKFFENGKVIEPRIYNGKKVTAQASGFDYKVIAEPTLNDGIISVDVYIQNLGSDFAPGNCTFAFTYEPDKLEYLYDEGVTGTENNPFNNNPSKGYDAVYSAPDQFAANPIPNVRTIEIDYDGYTRPKGVLCPHEMTKLGTLKFRVINESNEYKFNWHKLSVLLTVDGTDITDDGDWEEIEVVNVTRKAHLMIPNGGERWSSGRVYTIEWTKPTVVSNVYLEYSIDNGATWNLINDNPVDLSKQDYVWKTPRVNSTECLVRIVDATTGETVDISDNTFALVPVGAEIIRPALADGPYSGGQSDFIKWITDDATNVVFEFSANGETDWQKVTTEVSSDLEEITWLLPAVNTKTAKVRMIDIETGEILAVSERFVVLAGTLNFTYPSDNSTIDAGANAEIKWTFNNVQKFDLQFSADGGNTWEEVYRDVNALKGSEVWVVPNVSTDKAVLRALYNNDPEMKYDEVHFGINPVGVNDMNSAYHFAELMPNPFTGFTRIEFTIPFNETVTVTVLNSVGKKVATPISSVEYSAGTHAYDFDGSNLPAGVYYFHINAGTFNSVQRVVKIK